MNDTVDYELPFGPIGVLAHQLFVARSLQRIFDFRAQATSTIFGT